VAGYAAKRLAQVVPVLIGITLVTFLLLRLTGDPAAIMLPPGTPKEAMDSFRKEYGLDQPLYVQYLRFVGRALQGDFGMSIRYREPVLQLYLERLPATLELAVASMVLAMLVGIPIGVLSAAKHGQRFDNVVRLVALLGQAIPSFYLGLLLILVVAVQWRLLPTGGRGTWQQLILPALTLATLQVALIVRFTRGAVLDAMRQDYVRTARSKGLTELVLFQRHILKNAMLPVVTLIGLQVGTVFNGAVVTETVFSWPGIGRFMVDSISTRDFPVVQVTVMFVAVVFVATNLLVDLAYGWLDPRIKYA
jgi:peptide/nickel transport system permease protein